MRLGRDVVIELMWSSLGASIAEDADRGAFRFAGPPPGDAAVGLRQAAPVRLAEDVHIGNFVEVKRRPLARRQNQPLSNIGDASIGTTAMSGRVRLRALPMALPNIARKLRAGVSSADQRLGRAGEIGDGARTSARGPRSRNVARDGVGARRPRQIEKPGWAAGFPGQGNKK